MALHPPLSGTQELHIHLPPHALFVRTNVYLAVLLDHLWFSLLLIMFSVYSGVWSCMLFFWRLKPQGFFLWCLSLNYSSALPTLIRRAPLSPFHGCRSQVRRLSPKVAFRFGDLFWYIEFSEYTACADPSDLSCSSPLSTEVWRNIQQPGLRSPSDLPVVPWEWDEEVRNST